jgi:3-isopropylmalate/(R)-2-methylmalate dehydratase small subunit
MEKFTTLTGIAAPLPLDDVNTDQIAPVTRDFAPEYKELLFSRWRRRPDGGEIADFPLNLPQFRAARILVAGDNFGCGSSRESAVWAMLAFGIRCIVARSFAEFYRENCLQNGLLPIVLSAADAAGFAALVTAVDGTAAFTIDLQRQRIVCPDGSELAFDVPPADRQRLLEGLDDIGLSLIHAGEIADWERRIAGESPWLQQAADRRG